MVGGPVLNFYSEKFTYLEVLVDRESNYLSLTKLPRRTYRQVFYHDFVYVIFYDKATSIRLARGYSYSGVAPPGARGSDPADGARLSEQSVTAARGYIGVLWATGSCLCAAQVVAHALPFPGLITPVIRLNRVSRERESSWHEFLIRIFFSSHFSSTLVQSPACAVLHTERMTILRY